ncbi:unnamed protein product, partial [Brassica napus]
RLTGHSHFVEDVILSSDGQSTLSGSWDSELRLSDLAAGVSTRRFVGHTKDVISVAFSLDNRQIVSASRKDSVILLWDLAEGKKLYSLEANSVIHTLCFSPNRY